MKHNNYKEEEEKHYDSVFNDGAPYKFPNPEEYSRADKVLISSRQYIEYKTLQAMKSKMCGTLLDYGCSIGEKTHLFSSRDWKIIGIDISSNSIKVANRISKNMGLNSVFKVMDCELLDFNDNSFDIIYDFGTFSSLNMTKAFPELLRVLKPDGVLLAIETLGNNPIFVIKRKINALLKRRTKWAVSHICKIDDWKYFSQFFKQTEIKYFGLTTPYLAFILIILPSKIHYTIINFFTKLDEKLLKINILKRFAFKTVIEFSLPIKK